MVDIDKFKTLIAKKFDTTSETPSTYQFRAEGIRITVKIVDDHVYVETFVYIGNDNMKFDNNYYKVGIPEPSRIIGIAYYTYFKFETFMDNVNNLLHA